MRIFFDTNVLVSAFATRGLCEDLFRVVLAKHEVVVGEVVLEEFERVLSDKLQVPDELVDGALDLLRRQTVVARPIKPAGIDIDDPDDAWIVASVIESGADVLVTGDQDILRIAGQLPITVADPRGVWEMLRGVESDPVHSR